jgi:hypothetical protein
MTKFNAMKNYLILFTICLATLMACKAKKESTVSTEEKTEDLAQTMNDQEGEKRGEIVINTDGTMPESASVNILKADVQGDLLKLTVQYGGGCEKHIFTLYTNGMYMKSLPPQMSMQLHHEDNDDRCRALITETIAIDISSIRYGNKGPLIIRLQDYKETITYAY